MAHTYYPAVVTITFATAGKGWEDGDTAQLYSNAGSGAINSTTPHTAAKYELYGEHLDTTITVAAEADTPGTWIFGFKAADDCPTGGNVSSMGDTWENYIDLQPKKPAALGVTSYNKTTDDLVLTL